MITYKNVSILDAFQSGEINTILHQTNTCCGMGAGIAAVLAKKYPILRDSDKNYRSVVFNPEGSILVNEVENKRIINLYAQKNVFMSPGDEFETREGWLRNCLFQVKQLLIKDPTLKVGVPLIASGLGADRYRKLNKTDKEYFEHYIAPIIEEELSGIPITVYYL